MWAGKSCSWGGIPKIVDQGSILQVLILAPNTILLQTFFTTALLVYSSSKLCTTIGLIYTLTSTAMSMNNAFREIITVWEEAYNYLRWIETAPLELTKIANDFGHLDYLLVFYLTLFCTFSMLYWRLWHARKEKWQHHHHWKESYRNILLTSVEAGTQASFLFILGCFSSGCSFQNLFLCFFW